MPFDRDEVRRFARLAYLELPPSELADADALIDDARLDRLAHDLGRILDYVDQLGELDLDGVPPTSHGVPLPPLLRDDEVRPGLPTERALAGAPEIAGEAFCVPKVIE